MRNMSARTKSHKLGSLKQSTNGRISLFFKVKRKLNIPQLYQYIRDAADEDIYDAFVLTFYIRDCRDGKGERKIGRILLRWLFLNYPTQFMNVVKFVPEFGRWDDLLHLWPGVLSLHCEIDNPSDTQRKGWIDFLNNNFYSKIKNEKTLKKIQEYQQELVRLIGMQLIEDQKKMKYGSQASMCAKWAPTENGSLDREFDVVATLCNVMSWDKSRYRKVYLSPLRKYLKTTETFMCRGDWDSIDFNSVPSCAMKRLRRVFAKRTPLKFSQWREQFGGRSGQFHVRHLSPQEVIHEIGSKEAPDVRCQAEWMAIEEHVKSSGVFADALVVVDTSVSMKNWCRTSEEDYKFTPLDVAIGLGLLIASSAKGAFHNKVLTFSNNPRFVILNSVDAYERYHLLKESPWAGRTDLNATFSLILEMAQTKSIKPENFPTRLFIFSDMEREKAGELDLRDVDIQYKAAGYKRPQIVFLNVSGRGEMVANSSSISGFFPRVISAIIQGNSTDLWDITQTVIRNTKYNLIRVALNSQNST
jgi:hypothetical protein